MSLGVKLRKLRQQRNWSQTEAAQQLDVSQPAYNKWETDQAKPNIQNLMRISEIYEIDPYDLLQDVSNVVISHNKFKGSNIVYPNNSTIHMQISSEVLELILRNQEKITKTIDAQNELILSLLKKGKSNLS